MKFPLTISLLLCAFCAMAQTNSQDHDYLWIQRRAVDILVVPTNSPTRLIDLRQVEKKEDFGAHIRRTMQLVQEYELQGWEVVNVATNPNECFLLRKPKQ